ncbi:MAG TPA: phage holin family protein [Terriglobales bacterium]
MPSEKSMASVIAETKEEIKTFVQTRAQLLHAETKEKLKAWKLSIILIAVGTLLLITSWFAFVFAIVALLHSWFVAGSYAWCFGGLIVGGLLLICGLALGRAGYQRIRGAGMAPTRTLRILKRDSEWIQKQSRPA